MRELLTDTVRSLGFLTRLRLAARWFDGHDGSYARTASAFPVAGAVAVVPGALVLAGSDAAGLAPTLAALLAVATTLLVTGALHEDGLADSVDGLGGCDAERSLAIMRDSAVGVFGMLALVVVLGGRVLSLAEIDPVGALLGWIAAAALARAAMVWVWGRSEPARTDGAAAGAGVPSRSSIRMAAVLAALLALPALVWLGPFRMLAALALLLAATVAIRRVVMRRIGGHTGDTLGAVAALGETAVLVGLATG